MNDTTQQQVTPNQNPQEQAFYGKHKWMKWGLIYLAIAAIVYVGIYYFVLSKQGLNPYSVAPISTPQPTPTPTPYQLSPNQSLNSTWKTYVNRRDIQWSIKYPNDMVVKVLSKSAMEQLFGPDSLHAVNFIHVDNKYTGQYGLFSDGLELTIVLSRKSANISLERLFKNNIALVSTDFVRELQLDELQGYQAQVRGEGTFLYTYFPIQNTEEKYIFITKESYGQKKSQYDRIFDQILSTFRFEQALTTSKSPNQNPTPTSSQNQVLCTQDVKECPDGSYVGRQPPNCEFAPCPR